MKRMVRSIFTDVHSQRLEALAGYTEATTRAMRAGVHAIGAAYAEMAEIKPRHGVKSFDRMLSNKGLDVEALRPAWAQFVLGGRSEVLLAMDWTDFDDDDHTTLCLNVVTRHGRATPLFWKTVKKSELAGQRTDLEIAMLAAAERAIPPGVKVTLIADRGFGSQVLYEHIEGMGWDYVIRFRGSILVEHRGVSKPAKDWLSPNGRMRKLVDASVTADKTKVTVVMTRAKAMKEPWFLATNLTKLSATHIVSLYGRRFTIEESFRDTKDLRFGMGLRATHIRSAARRDRLLLLLAIAQGFLTLIGAASEHCGMDAWLKVNTVKKRTHSLYRQGIYWYGALPNMREDWFRKLTAALAHVLDEHASLKSLLGSI